MADSSIEWTEKVWNPCTGCNKVSRGCKFCYAEIMHNRQHGINPEKYAHDFLEGAFEYEPALPIPFGWKKPATVFPTSMSDLFHKNISVEFIAKVYAVMFLTQRHTYQMLTKRPERRLEVFQSDEFFEYLHKYCNEYFNKYVAGVPYESEVYSHDDIKSLFPFKNIWEGTSVEDQPAADKRIDLLLQTPAAVRWLSCEPIVSALSLEKWLGVIIGPARIHGHDYLPNKIDWVVAGGESGNRKGIQPLHPDWILSLRDQCQDAAVPFFFKQWGEYTPGSQESGTSITILNDGDFCISGWEHSLLGRNDKVMDPEEWQSYKPTRMTKVGKHEAGRLLDGREWNEYPDKVQSEKQITV